MIEQKEQKGWQCDKSRWLNDIDRIERIQDFKAKVKFNSIHDEVLCSIEFSDEVVLPKHEISIMNHWVASIIEDKGESALIMLNEEITEYMRDLLLECEAMFKGETKPDVVVESDQTVQMEDGEVCVKNVEWS